MNIPQLFFESMYLYLPAMVANMAPIFAHKLRVLQWLNKPLDFGLHMGGTRVLGDNKTIRGFIVAILAGAATAWGESLLYPHAPYEYASSALVLGTVLGCGALVGDAVKSFFKRRMNIASGSSWIPFDQIDFVLGATLAGLFFMNIPIAVVLIALVVVPIASYIVSVVGVALHIKRSL